MATSGAPVVPVSIDNIPSSQFNPPPDWIAVIVLVGSMLVIALMIVVVRTIVLRNPEIIPTHRDPESANLGRVVDPQLEAQTISALDSLAPPRPYSKLTKSDGTLAEIPPDQSGPSVECVICLEMFKGDSMVRCLKCHHIFHAECINKWLLKHHNTCPLCMACYIPQSALPTRPPRVLPYPELHLLGQRVLADPEAIPRNVI